jgi:hypothetical protein
VCSGVRGCRSGRSVRSCGRVRGWCVRVFGVLCSVGRSVGWVGGWVDTHARAGWFYTERGMRAGLAPIASASPRPGFTRSVEHGGARQRNRPTHVLQFF